MLQFYYKIINSVKFKELIFIYSKTVLYLYFLGWKFKRAIFIKILIKFKEWDDFSILKSMLIISCGFHQYSQWSLQIASTPITLLLVICSAIFPPSFVWLSDKISSVPLVPYFWDREFKPVNFTNFVNYINVY